MGVLNSRGSTVAPAGINLSLLSDSLERHLLQDREENGCFVGEPFVLVDGNLSFLSSSFICYLDYKFANNSLCESRQQSTENYESCCRKLLLVLVEQSRQHSSRLQDSTSRTQNSACKSSSSYENFGAKSAQHLRRQDHSSRQAEITPCIDLHAILGTASMTRGQQNTITAHPVKLSLLFSANSPKLFSTQQEWTRYSILPVSLSPMPFGGGCGEKESQGMKEELP